MKPNKTWFKDHGWEKTVDEVQEEPEYSQTIKRHQVSYTYRSICGRHEIYARWDHIVTSRYYKNELEKRSSYYMFYAYNNRTKFCVENKISHRPLTEGQIKAAMLTVGVVM